MVVAALAGLGHGLHGWELIEDRGILTSLMSALVLATVWASSWLILRTVLTKIVDLSRPAVKVGYIGGILLVAAVLLDNLTRDDTDYLRDYPFVVVTLIVWGSVVVGGLPGMILGQLVAWRRDLRHHRVAPVAGRPAPQQPRLVADPAPMLIIGEPNPRGPLDDLTGTGTTDPQKYLPPW